MSLFTMPDGSAGADLSSGFDSSGLSSSGTDWSALTGINGYSGAGDGYGFATGTDTLPQSASSQTLGQLQSGGSTVDWNQLLQGGLTALIAGDSIAHGLSATGQALPTYKAPNGGVYPVGYGPNYSPQMMQSGNSGFMLLLIVGLVVFALAEEKH